mgnify:CR=1 FL=1
MAFFGFFGCFVGLEICLRDRVGAVFGWRAGMVRALSDGVPRREGGSNGGKGASGGSERRGRYVLGGGK